MKEPAIKPVFFVFAQLLMQGMRLIDGLINTCDPAGVDGSFLLFSIYM
jgi:hypothetical protein